MRQNVERKGLTLLAEHILMLLYDAETGRPLFNSHEIDLILGGAVMADLIVQRRLELTEPNRITKNRTVVVVDTTPTGDRILDEALERIAARRSTRSHVVVSRISKGVRDQLLERLAGRGLLVSDVRRLAGILPVKAWPAVDTSNTLKLRRDLQNVLVGEKQPTPQEAAIISLLFAARRTRKVLGNPELDHRELKQRAKAIAEASPAAEAVRQAIDTAAF